MSKPLDAAELIESLDRHFLAGCPSLSTSQLRSHQARGFCRECVRRATAALREQQAISASMAAEARDDG